MQPLPGPHQDQPILTAGEPLTSARAAMIMVHGRGANAADILGLAREFTIPGFAFVAPEAAGHTWYPYSFLSPIPNNEPGISSGLAVIGGIVANLSEAGMSADRVILLGFSQGACLSTEFAARHPQRFGGVIGLSGGLIGPPETPRNYPGTLDGTPVFLGCGDVDPHIPKERVEESATVFERMGALVTLRLYPGMPHTVNQNEIDLVRVLMESIVKSRLT